MPKTKFHRTVERHRKKQKQNAASATNTHGIDVKKIDWTSIDNLNPFSLPLGVELFE